MAHDFNVRLSGIELSSSEEQQLNKAIQSAVLGHLAGSTGGETSRRSCASSCRRATAT